MLNKETVLLYVFNYFNRYSSLETNNRPGNSHTGVFAPVKL